MTFVHLPRVLAPRAIKALREKVLRGEALTQHEALTLLGSHEQVRAFFLASRHRAHDLESENAAMLQSLKLQK